jgi:hypothetical protein
MDNMNDQIDAGWVKVGTYSNAFEANSDSALLTSLRIPSTVQDYGMVEWYVWVPNRFATEAKKALKTALSEVELTSEALKWPPPDDA